MKFEGKKSEDFQMKGCRATVVLEWDKLLGPKWLNEQNLEVLFFTPQCTRPDLLNVKEFTYEGDENGSEREEQEIEPADSEIQQGLEQSQS
jgi:hypothetical protein